MKEETREVHSGSLRVDSFNTGTAEKQLDKAESLKLKVQREIQIRNKSASKACKAS